MKKYNVINAVEFGTQADDVRRFEAGETIELEDKHAEQLIEVGAISAPLEAPAKTKK